MKVLKDNAAEIVGCCLGVDIFWFAFCFTTGLRPGFKMLFFLTECVLHNISHSHFKTIIEIIPDV